MPRFLLVLRRLFAASSLLFAASASAEPGPTSTPDPSSASDYRLQPQDLLRVQVFQEPDLLREVRISQEGTITLPLIERVDLRNKTLRQAEQLIRELYDRDFLVNPQITLVVIEYAQRTVNVLGNVNQPGAISFPQEQKLNLIDAITRAGGFTRLADRKRVKLTRASPDGRTQTFEINADQLVNRGDAPEKWDLQVGDTVFVPERVL